MTEHRHIGRSVPRPEGPDKATGRARYIHDLERPGMLHARVLHSAHAHARILNIDTSRAERLPGIKAVITADNTPELRVGFLRDNLALKKGKVRQFRDEVAAVAATDPDIAAEAIALIRVEYEPLPAVFDPEEALLPGAPLVHEFDPRGKPLASNRIKLAFPHVSGDVEQGRQQARHVVEGAYSSQMQQHSCLGTSGCIAEFDLHGNLTLWAKTQIPFLAQKDFLGAMPALGLRGRNVRVVVPEMGGAFGSGLDTHPYEFISILLAWRTGRPVKMLYDRQQEFAYLPPRQSARTRISQGCDANGRLTFRTVDVLQDNGAYVSWGATYPSVMMVPVTSLYRVPNVQFGATLVYTNNPYCQAMRGYGSPEVTWAIESNLDELAQAAGIDPLEIRRINCNQPGETTPMGLKVSTCGLRECLDNAAAKVRWNEKRGQGRSRGVGIASLCHVGGSGRIYRSDGTGLVLKLDDFGNVNVLSGGVEIGQGFRSALTLGVAESLGVLPEKVFVAPTDTATCPWDVGTHASRGAFTSLNAAAMAAEKARKRIFELAVELFPGLVAKQRRKLLKRNPELSLSDFDPRTCTAEDYELRDGVLFIEHAPDEPWLRLGLDRFLRAIHFRDGGEMLTVEAFYEPPSELPDWTVGRGNLSATYAYGAHAVEVEVDEETGEVHILRLVASHDVGRILNRQTLEGQIYGALAQGVGLALYEDVLTQSGRVLNAGFTDYKIPTAREMAFPIELDFVETHDEFGPFGAKGVGEPGLVPTAPAIANAIYDAVGVRIRDLPITPEKLLAALEEKRGRC